MDYNKRIEALIGISLEDYPGSEYSPRAIQDFPSLSPKKNLRLRSLTSLKK